MSTAIDCFANETATYYDKLKELVEEAERRAINRHKYTMSLLLGEEVEFERAAQDWLQNHAKEWRENRLKRMLRSQCEEIRRYKWIASERAGRDLGGSAVEEWIYTHGPIWRYEWEESHIDEEEDACDGE